MSKRLLFGVILAGMFWSAVASAGIPEPDNILYGQVCIGGSPASADDDVTIIAKATVADQVCEVGRYKMGNNDSATDCNGDADCYVLRVRLESVPSGESASGRAVVLDRAAPATVQVYLRQGEEPAQLVKELQIPDLGVIQRLDLYDAAATADLNGDGHGDLQDYQIFGASFQGPNVAVSGVCNPADLNGDGYVDLRDFAVLQASFTGSG